MVTRIAVEIYIKATRLVFLAVRIRPDQTRPVQEREGAAGREDVKAWGRREGTEGVAPSRSQGKLVERLRVIRQVRYGRVNRLSSSPLTPAQHRRCQPLDWDFFTTDVRGLAKEESGEEVVSIDTIEMKLNAPYLTCANCERPCGGTKQRMRTRYGPCNSAARESRREVSPPK
ncbi:hypothetical protein E2C01_095091 [Portunus trituberculatus]|uniref:Uncharacterized protein n=1 Tax=Portunus trituberculatus TaxID=210409 RepID=A0A5B7JZ33_PORTR|nr:hypothetical protein [Portunus trituberculatus]